MSKEDLTIEERLRNIENLLQLDKPVYTVHDTALVSGYEESYIYKLTHRREIPHYKPRGGTIYFNPPEIKAWCLSNRVPTLTEKSQEADKHLLKNKKGKKL
jgi:hypothetical protein